MTGKECPQRKSKKFSLQNARGSTRWCCYAGGCKDCLAAQYLAALLDDTCQVDVVGTATESETGLKLCAELRPDAAFLDIKVPDKDGVSLATQLAMLPQPPRLVFPTGSADRAIDAFRLEAVKESTLLVSRQLEERLRQVTQKSAGLSIHGVSCSVNWGTPRRGVVAPGCRERQKWKCRKGCLDLTLNCEQLTCRKRETMEALVFGIIASIALKKKQERIVPEPAELQPFDLRNLGRFHDNDDNSPSRISDRKRSYVAQTMS
jgi:DNA-binding LytR/AlgR family response regulator